MEVVKKKILLEDSIDRGNNSPTWGILTASTFYINIMITQNIDDMGLFTDIDFISSNPPTNIEPDYTILIDKLNTSGFTFPFMSGVVPQPTTNITISEEVILRLPSKIKSDFYSFGNSPITGATDSKIEDVRSYDAINPFKPGFNIDSQTYINYDNVLVNGVSRVKTIGEPKQYVFDTEDDINLGTDNQVYGLQYLDYTGTTRKITIGGVTNTIPLTTLRYIGEGLNETNTSLSALTKEEYLFGITSPATIQSDVFIDRGITTVMDMHLRMSEIKDLAQLVRYGNGFYKINKQ